MGPFWILPAAWWAVAAGFFLAGAVPALGAWIFTLRATRTYGRIVKIGTRTHNTISSNNRSRGSVTQHLPEVAFTVDGVEYVAVATAGPRLPLWSVGDELPLAYLPANPTVARVLGHHFNYARPFGRIVFAVFLAAVGVIAWLAIT